MILRTLVLFFLFTGALQAQTTVGLVAYYGFNGDFIDLTGNTSNTGIAVGTPTFSCGVAGQAVLLDGANDQIRIPNSANVAGEFDREDFTISFYFKSVGLNGTQYLFSKRDTSCMNPREISVRVRSTRPPADAMLTPTGPHSATVTLALAEQGVSPGQACVFYEGTRVLGGGWITR